MTEHMSWAPSRIFPTNLEPGGNPWTPIWGKSKIWLGYSLAVYELAEIHSGAVNQQ